MSDVSITSLSGSILNPFIGSWQILTSNIIYSTALAHLDIKMPKMDGFELYNELKKRDSNVKVCFLTASELYYKEFRKKEYCALDKNLFIQKPIDNEELFKEVNKIIESC
jgi:FixJ family two-component response regulator